MRERPDALAIDLDGVLRHFDPAVAGAAEQAAGLAPGALAATAFRHDLLQPALLGHVTYDAWCDSVVADLVARSGADPGRAREAVGAWAAYRGEVVTAVRDFVAQVRAGGVPVCLATNATSRLDAELAALGLADAVDAVVNSSVVGAHKPTREFFAAVCAALGRPASRCLFVDDDDRNVRGARAAGLPAYRWNGTGDLPYLRAALGM